jgi:transposase
MGEVSTIGLDIAKSVFQVHGVDVEGAVVIRKRVSRAKVLEFFSTLPSSVALKPARAHIIGAVSFRRSATRYD